MLKYAADREAAVPSAQCATKEMGLIFHAGNRLAVWQSILPNERTTNSPAGKAMAMRIIAVPRCTVLMAGFCRIQTTRSKDEKEKQTKQGDRGSAAV